MKWPKYWSFSFSISPSNEHPGLISFRMDWLDLLAVHGTLKSLLQQFNLVWLKLPSMPKKSAMKENCAAANVDHFRYEFPSFKSLD